MSGETGAAQEHEINSDDTADTAMDIYAMTTTMQRKKREKEMQARSKEMKQMGEQRGYACLICFNYILNRQFRRDAFCYY